MLYVLQSLIQTYSCYTNNREIIFLTKLFYPFVNSTEKEKKFLYTLFLLLLQDLKR